MSGHHAAMFSRWAQLCTELEDEGTVVHYYQAIDKEVEAPIFIQNHARVVFFFDRYNGAFDQ